MKRYMLWRRNSERGVELFNKKESRPAKRQPLFRYLFQLMSFPVACRKLSDREMFSIFFPTLMSG